MSTSDGTALRAYRDSLSGLHALAREEERELARRWSAGDQLAGSKLVEACLPFVVSIALRSGSSFLPFCRVIAVSLCHGDEVGGVFREVGSVPGPLPYTEAVAAGAGEQTKFPIAESRADDVQQRLRVGRREPCFLGHLLSSAHLLF